MTTNMMIRAARAPLAMLVLAFGGCNILDVENPNNLVEEDIHQPSAATAVVNGSLALVTRSVSYIWQPYLMATDEFRWIGSRDAWQTLDEGGLSDFNNEFTDAAFPQLAEARWMADEAVKTLEAHVAETPTTQMKTDLARAYFLAGTIYTVIGEVQQDFAFSNKQEAAPPVGEENMVSVFDQAIAYLGKALAGAQEVGDAELETRVLATRARSAFSRGIWMKIKPTPNTADPLVKSPEAVQDAQAVLAMVDPDWKWQFTYSSATVTNDMAGWINSRAENQFDYSLVNVEPTSIKKIVSVKLLDPIDGIPDPVVTAKITEWKGGDIGDTGDDYPPLTWVSARLMHLIIAEDALANGNTATFTDEINAVRALNGLTPFSGQVSNMEILQHERRVNLLIMGLRLADMYRFGIQDELWLSTSDAVVSPGSLLPITIIERRANPFLSGSG